MTKEELPRTVKEEPPRMTEEGPTRSKEKSETEEAQIVDETWRALVWFLFSFVRRHPSTEASKWCERLLPPHTATHSRKDTHTRSTARWPHKGKPQDVSWSQVQNYIYKEARRPQERLGHLVAHLIPVSPAIEATCNDISYGTCSARRVISSVAI